MSDADLGRAVLELTADDRGLSAALTAAERKAVGLKGAFSSAGSAAKGFGQDVSSSSRTVATSLDGITSKAKAMGAALGLAFSVAGVAAAVTKYVQYAGTIQDLSKKAGTSAEAFQRLSYAAKLNVGSMEQVAQGATKLSQTLTQGGDSVVSAVNELGLNLDDLRRKDPADAFIEIGDAIGRVPNPMRQSALATKLFGEAGAQFLPMFKGNLSATAAEAERLGLVLSQQTIDAADEFGDTVDTLKISGMALLGQVLTPMLPGLTQLAQDAGALAADVIPKVVKGLSDVVAIGIKVGSLGPETWKTLPEPLRETAKAAAELTAGLWALNTAMATVKGSAFLAPALGHLKDMVRLVQWGGLAGLSLIFKNWGAALTEGVLGPLGIVVGALSTLRGMSGSWAGAIEDIFNVLRGMPALNAQLNLMGVFDDAKATQAALQNLTELGLKPVASHGAAAAPGVAKLSDALQKLLDKFTGRALLQTGQQYAFVLGRIGDVSKLTAAEQAEIAKAFDAVIEKYRLIGGEVGARVVEHFEALRSRLPLVSSSLGTFATILPDIVEPEEEWNDVLHGTSLYVSNAGDVLGYLAAKTKAEEERIKALNAAMGPLATFLPTIVDETKETGEALSGADEETQDWTSSLGELSQAFSQLAQISGGSLSGIVGGVGKTVASLDTMAKGVKAFDTAKKAMDAAKDSAGKVAAGIGMVSSALSASVAAFSFPLILADAFDSAARKQRQIIEQNEEMVESFVDAQGGVEDLRDKLELCGLSWDAWAAVLERVKGDAKQTELVIEHLTEQLDYLAARQEAAQTATDKLGELTEDWLKPIEDAKKALEDAEKAYSDLVASGERDPLKLEAARQKVTQMKKALYDLKVESQKDFNEIAAYAVADFAALNTTTGDFYGSLEAIGPTLDELIKGQDALGLSGSAAIQQLLKIREVQTKYEDVLGPLHTATEIVDALGEAGVVSGESISQLGLKAKEAYKKMIAGGVDSNTAMALMQPTLQTLYGAWKENKGAVDEETGAILEQAEQMGLVGEDEYDTNKQLLGIFKDLKGAIDEMRIAIQEFGTAAEEGFRKAKEGAESYGKAVPRGTPTTGSSGSDSDSGSGGNESESGGGSGGGGQRRNPGGTTSDGGATSGSGGDVGSDVEFDTGDDVPVGYDHFPARTMHWGGPVGRTPTSLGGAFRRASQIVARRAHVGMFVSDAALAADEVPIIAQTGEGVLSRVGMRALGGEAPLNALNRGGAAGESPLSVVTHIDAHVEVPFTVQAIDVADFEKRVVRDAAPAIFRAVKRGQYGLNTLAVESMVDRMFREIKGKLGL
jgi:methyl-accepting chemotaxis protein